MNILLLCLSIMWIYKIVYINGVYIDEKSGEKDPVLVYEGNVLKIDSGHTCKFFICPEYRSHLTNCTGLSSDRYTMPILNYSIQRTFLQCGSSDFPVKIFPKNTVDYYFATNITKEPIRKMYYAFLIQCRSSFGPVNYLTWTYNCNMNKTNFLTYFLPEQITNKTNITLENSNHAPYCDDFETRHIKGYCRAFDFKYHYIEINFSAQFPTYVDILEPVKYGVLYGNYSCDCMEYENASGTRLPYFTILKGVNKTMTYNNSSWYPIILKYPRMDYYSVCNDTQGKSRTTKLTIFRSYKFHFTLYMQLHSGEYLAPLYTRIRCHACILKMEHNDDLQIIDAWSCKLNKSGQLGLIVQGKIKKEGRKGEKWNDFLDYDYTTTSPIVCRIYNSFFGTLDVSNVTLNWTCDIIPVIDLYPYKSLYYGDESIFCRNELYYCSENFTFKLIITQLGNDQYSETISELGYFYFNETFNGPDIIVQCRVYINKTEEVQNQTMIVNIKTDPNDLQILNLIGDILKPFDILICVSNAYPKPRYSWLIDNSITLQSSGQLFLISTEIREGNHNITCQATNSFGAHRTSLIINVFNPLNRSYKHDFAYNWILLISGFIYVAILFLLLTLVFSQGFYKIDSKIEKRKPKVILKNSNDETLKTSPTSPVEQTNKSNISYKYGTKTIEEILKNRRKNIDFKLYKSDIIIKCKLTRNCNNYYKISNNLLSNQIINRTEEIYEFTEDKLPNNTTADDYRDFIIHQIFDIIKLKYKQ